MQNEYQSYQCQICQRYLIFQENIFEPIDPIYLTTFAKQSQQFDQNEQQNLHLSFSEQLFEEFRKNSPMMKDPELFNFEVIYFYLFFKIVKESASAESKGSHILQMHSEIHRK